MDFKGRSTVPQTWRPLGRACNPPARVCHSGATPSLGEVRGRCEDADGTVPNDRPLKLGRLSYLDFPASGLGGGWAILGLSYDALHMAQVPSESLASSNGS